MSARLPQDQVDLLQRAADELDGWAEGWHDPGTEEGPTDEDQTLFGGVARLLRWTADPESAGPVLHQSALAIARAVLGEPE